MGKIGFFIPLSIIISLSSYAQSNQVQTMESRIGVTYSTFGEHSIVRFREIEDDAGYSVQSNSNGNGNEFYVAGINYLYPLTNVFEFETGIEYANHIFYILSTNPLIDAAGIKTNISVINIPLSLRINFARYFFVNTGLNMDINSSESEYIDSQTGIGCIIGFGLKYDSHFGVSVFVNPYFKAYSLIPFAEFDNHQRLMESGLRFGLMYKLNLSKREKNNGKYRLPCS
jgi:hypothetical protein